MKIASELNLRKCGNCRASGAGSACHLFVPNVGDEFKNSIKFGGKKFAANLCQKISQHILLVTKEI